MAKTKSTPKNIDAARERGFIPFERKLDLEHPGVAAITKRIRAYLKKPMADKGTVFDENWGVTLLGYNDFGSTNFDMAPPTAEIIDQVKGLDSPLWVTLGAMGLYGGKRNTRLGITVHSSTLREQREAVAEIYRGHNIPVHRPDLSRGEYTPHISVATVDASQRYLLAPQAALDDLTVIAGVIGASVQLLGATRPPEAA